MKTEDKVQRAIELKASTIYLETYMNFDDILKHSTEILDMSVEDCIEMRDVILDTIKENPLSEADEANCRAIDKIIQNIIQRKNYIETSVQTMKTLLTNVSLSAQDNKLSKYVLEKGELDV